MHTVFIPYKSIFLSESVFSPILCGPMECGLPLEFFSQEFWSGLSFPTPGYLPNPEIESESLESPALTTDSLLLVPPEKYVPQFSSVAQSCPTLCYPMNRGTPGLPVHHQLPVFTQTHVYRVGDAIQPSHPLSSPSPPAPSPSQHQGLFQ